MCMDPYTFMQIRICIGDFRQIPPVVPHSNAKDVTNALISSSQYWRRFKRFHLNINMRLTALRLRVTEETSPEQRRDIENQERYSKLILAVAEGRSKEDCVVLDTNEEEHRQSLALRGVMYFTESQREEALHWLYGDHEEFNPSVAIDNIILAATNKAGD